MRFAYLSQGKIYLKDGSGPARLVESKYAAETRRRALEMEQRNAWKTEGRGAQFMRGGALWGAAQQALELPAQVTGLARGCAEGQLVYSLDTRDVSGVFRLGDQGCEEQRLLHTADFRVREVCGDARAGKIAFVLAHRDGTSAIATMNHDGGELAELTQGDTQDMAPRWTPAGDGIVYQSAGIGRNQAGVAVGRGPFVIEKLNLQNGEVETLAEEPNSDLLGPKVAGDGALWYIRRPYTPPNQKTHPLRAVLDLLLLPFRIIYAFFQYLNFFSAKYTGKFLTSGGGAAKEADVRQMMIWGNLVEASRQNVGKSEETPDLVPASWQLVRQSTGGERTTVAKNVLTFDLGGNGEVLYSNGNAIFCRDAAGETQRVEKTSFIQHVVAL